MGWCRERKVEFSLSAEQMENTKKRTDHQCTCPTCRAHPRSTTAKEHWAIHRVLALLDEKSRRRFVGLLALQGGRGGIEWVREITGVSRPTIRRGREEVQRAESATEHDRVRRVGAGRRVAEKNNRNS